MGRHCAARMALQERDGKNLFPMVLAVVTRPLANSSTFAVVDIVTLAKKNNAYIHLSPLGEIRRLKYAAFLLSIISKQPIPVVAIPPRLCQVSALLRQTAGPDALCSFSATWRPATPRPLRRPSWFVRRACIKPSQLAQAMMSKDALGEGKGTAFTITENGRIVVRLQLLEAASANRRAAGRGGL